MQQPKKLIEVAMPVKEISAESVRDKSIRHGHISTLHLWWARRPLPVCRAVVFASLVPDPLDENCPQAFKDAVKILLGQPFGLNTKHGFEEHKEDWYKPYTDIPYTASHDLMDDNLRNRLLMFIGKFSDRFVENERKGKPSSPKEQLSDASLIKWESRNNDSIIGRARKLIWVAHNCKNSASSAEEFLTQYDSHYQTIKDTERELYSSHDRHINNDRVKSKEKILRNAIDTFLAKMPKVFDPFAGGGAIPLEAARLGCKSYGNDINPVAHIIQKGGLEFSQIYGKPITYSKGEFEKIYGEDTFTQLPLEWKKIEDGETKAIRIPNRLSFDVEFYAKQILKKAQEQLNYLYPADEKGNKPIAYYWARVGICSNPSCKAEVPLLKQFYLSKRRGASENDYVYLEPSINGNRIDFTIKQGLFEVEGWINRGNLVCPCCGNVTPNNALKGQFKKEIKERLLAVIFDTKTGKKFQKPSDKDYKIEFGFNFDTINIPKEPLPITYSKGMAFCLWGFHEWGQMFNRRQLVCINCIVDNINILKQKLANDDYGKIITLYLAILVDRIIARNNSFVIWHTQQDTIEHPFSRQAIQMVFDYPEMNPFGLFSGGALGQLNFILDVINEHGGDIFPSTCNNTSSGEIEFFEDKSLTAVVTDPPYFDAIAYADLSDFFYVWLKRILGDIFPYNFATPLTPKTEECTALKHRHEEDDLLAKKHFETKLTQILFSIENQTTDIVSIMFAHQSTEAWTTLCNSILNSNLNITGSWAIDTENTGALKTNKAFLSSSVSVSCQPLVRQGTGNFKDIKGSIEQRVRNEVEKLYKLGFRGSDLLTACFGQAVSEFGQYQIVERADGSKVNVSDLLEIARDSAFNALLKGFEADEFTKFYIAWCQLYNFTESDFDDVNRLVKIGLSIETNSLFQEKLLIKNLNKQSLAGYSQRVAERPNLGTELSDPIIDQAHKGMHYFKKNDRKALLLHIAQVANSPESLFWRVINSLVEILPLDKDHDDKKIATELLASKDNLIRDSKQVPTSTSQTTLGL